MATTLEQKEKLTVFLGERADPNRPLGSYLVFRCGTCANVHVGFAVPSHFAEPHGALTTAQITMSADEARQLAAELLAIAEEH